MTLRLLPHKLKVNFPRDRKGLTEDHHHAAVEDASQYEKPAIIIVESE